MQNHGYVWNLLGPTATKKIISKGIQQNHHMEIKLIKSSYFDELNILHSRTHILYDFPKLILIPAFWDVTNKQSILSFRKGASYGLPLYKKKYYISLNRSSHKYSVN